MTLLRQLTVFIVALLVVGAAPSIAQGGQPSSAPAPAARQTSANTAQQNAQRAYTLPPAKLAKAIALSRIRDTLAISESVWGIVFLWLLLSAGGWSRIERWAQRRTERRWLQGVLFFFALFILTTIASLPFEYYGQYASRSYGVSVQTWPSWCGDQAKGLGVVLVIGTLVLLLFNRMVRRWPRRYWIGAWAATIPIIVVLIFLSPMIIDPLFNQFEPLELHHAALVTKLEKVVARTGIDIPPSRMFLMKASRKYNGINAYVTGIGASKRYVMWDTATDRLPDDEVLFVFGHESGHYVLHHIPKGIAGLAVGLFFVYWACAAIAGWLVRRFGAGWGATDLASRTGFVVLLFVVSVAGFLLQPVNNAFSRYFEHQADVYGQEAIHGIVADPQKTAVSAFNHLGEAWLEDPRPNPFIEFWLYNHPSTQHRAQFAARYDPWANGGHGEFFAK